MDLKDVYNLTKEALERELRLAFPVASDLQAGFTGDAASMVRILDSVGIEFQCSEFVDGEVVVSLFRKPHSPAESPEARYLPVGSTFQPNEQNAEWDAVARALLKFYLCRDQPEVKRILNPWQ